MDSATYVAAALGVPKENITWVRADLADREKLLEDGDVGLVFSTYSITDDRAKVEDFAGPYFVAHQDLLVRRNETDITGLDTLDGRVLCSVTGTTSSQYIKDNYLGRIELIEYPRFSDCVAALADTAEVADILDGARLYRDKRGNSAQNPLFAGTNAQWRAAALDWMAAPDRNNGAIMTSLLVDARPIHGDPGLSEVNHGCSPCDFCSRRCCPGGPSRADCGRRWAAGRSP